jgi:hypothetical protein
MSFIFDSHTELTLVPLEERIVQIAPSRGAYAAWRARRRAYLVKLATWAATLLAGLVAAGVMLL